MLMNILEALAEPNDVPTLGLMEECVIASTLVSDMQMHIRHLAECHCPLSEVLVLSAGATTRALFLDA